MSCSVLNIPFLMTVVFTVMNDVWSLEDFKKSCRPGQALADIYWTAERPTFKHFSIKCEDVTNACTEICEWSIKCDKQRYGPNFYTRGINAVYDAKFSTQRMFWLCCNVTSKIDRQCSKRLVSLNGHPKEIPQGNVETVREAASNFKELDPSPLELDIEFCTHEKIKSPTCPLDDMDSKVTVDPGLAGSAGLAGLAGLAGVALIKKPAPAPAQAPVPAPAPLPPPPPCCCALVGAFCPCKFAFCTGPDLACDLTAQECVEPSLM